MELQELYDLMERFADSGLSMLEWRRGDEQILLRRDAAPAVPGAPISAPQAAPAAAPATPAAEEEGEVFKAPLVGTFYVAPAPDQPPFVRPGKPVKKGETMCLIEAMKMMSEIPAPADCVVEEVLVKDGEPVGFGQPLFRLRKD